MNPALDHTRGKLPPAGLTVRGIFFVFILATHCVGLGLAWRMQPSFPVVTPTPGILQVRWVSPERAPEPPATPEPEIAPKPLPMRPQPRPRARPLPVLAVPDTIPSHAEQPVALAQAEETPAPQEETAPAAPEGAPATGGSVLADANAVAPPRYEADYLSNPAPEYPPLSRRLHEQGFVTLRIHITADGRADQVHLQKSSGFARLDQAASTVVWRWRFIPARRGQENVPGWVLVPIRFNLRS
jgi:protein TonB